MFCACCVSKRHAGNELLCGKIRHEARYCGGEVYGLGAQAKRSQPEITGGNAGNDLMWQGWSLWIGTDCDGIKSILAIFVDAKVLLPDQVEDPVGLP